MAKYQVEIVNCYSLNIRNGAGTSFKIIAWAKKGEKYTSSKQSGGWYYLDEKKGWSKGNYVKVIKNFSSTNTTKVNTSKGTVKSTTKTPNSNIRSDIDYGSVSDIINGNNELTADQKVAVLGKDGRIATLKNQKVDLEDFEGGSTLSTFGSKDFDTTIHNYRLNYEFISKNLETIRKNYNIKGESNFKNIKKNLFSRFNRFKIAFPDYYLTKTFSHVFFTRPDLNVLNSNGTSLNRQFSKDPLFGYLFNNNPDLVKSLTSHFSGTHDFHPFLSNTANSFELSDEYIKTIEYGETFTGYKVLYGRHNVESNTAGEFSITYQDDSSFHVYKTHKAWIDYISKVYRGSKEATREHRIKKIIDYAASVYYFVCGADGETILFWSKFFGVFPINAPASVGSWSKGSGPKIPEFSVKYGYASKEDLNPLSLAEFNMNSSEDFKYRKIHEKVLVGTGRTMSGAPFIASATDPSGAAIYKLKFRV